MRSNMWQLEWIGYAQEVEIDVIVEMVDLQRFLGRWSKRWTELETHPEGMTDVQFTAREWSNRALEWADLN